MGKLISDIHNYPLSEGAVAYSNKMLLEDNFSIRTNTLKDYLKSLFEISKDIYFFNDLGKNSNTWNDLLKKDIIFQLSRFLTISAAELNNYFTDLPQANAFTSDTVLTTEEYNTLAYQRLQIIQYIFWFYKTIGESINSDSLPQVLSILKSDIVSKLFIRYQALLDECINNSPILILEAHKINAGIFNGISFPPVDSSITSSLKAYYNPASIPGNQVLDIYSNEFDKIKAANEYAYSIFKALLQVQQSFNYWATNKLTEITSTSNTHQPHIALLIVFCKLAMLYDAQYNLLIHKNTAFVFGDILQLQKQSVLPDTAYVSIELARNINQYILPQHTLFKAGKNSLGKTLYYQSTKDIVLNSAKISYLKSSVRVTRQSELFTVSATDDASSAEWQANNAWMPFNDLGESYTGMAIESKLLETIQKKDTLISFEFEFDNNLPQLNDFAEKLVVSLLLSDGSEIVPSVTIATTLNHFLKITANIEKDLKASLKTGLNVRLKLASPGKDKPDTDAYALLYKSLLNDHISRIKVKLNKQSFAPLNVDTSAGLVDGSTSFAAFGAQSMAGSSFHIHHPFLKYANVIDIIINWAEKLTANLPVTLPNISTSLSANTETSTINNFNNGRNNSISVQLTKNHTYEVQSVLTGSVTTTIKTMLPRVVLVKSIQLKGDLEELVYEKDNIRPVMYVEEIVDTQRFIKSLLLPFVNKTKQKKELMIRHLQYRLNNYVSHHNNLTAHLYPLGMRKVNTSTRFTFLPDYTILGFNDFVGDLYIGFTNTTPGQSISLLFDIAEETAEQSELEAKISWHFITKDNFEAIDPSKIIDTTNNFLQSGIVQLTLPETATHSNNILEGMGSYCLVARCDKNYEVVANIRSIRTNGVAIERVLDANNQEIKKSVAPASIENIYPKTANVKSVSQEMPSLNGREAETDLHYFWRSSQRLRHKQRGINQWDVEQIILEKFSNIYKVKCLNHAWYNNDSVTIIAKPAHTIIMLIPHYIVDRLNPNFQPAIAMSKISGVQSYLQQKTSPFLQFQVLNASWDVICVKLEAVLNKDILDLLFYREQLNMDVMKFFSPWAFEAIQTPALSQKVFAATLIDFIDELTYVHHIRSIRIFKNGIEVFDEITSSSEIHLLTSATEHTITALPYDNQ